MLIAVHVVFEKGSLAMRPKALAFPKCISSSLPGARPTPFHSVWSLWVMTHTKPLCFDFCTDAWLTREMRPFAWLTCIMLLLGCSCQMGPNSGFCHASRVVWNCTINNQWCNCCCVGCGAFSRRSMALARNPLGSLENGGWPKVQKIGRLRMSVTRWISKLGRRTIYHRKGLDVSSPMNYWSPESNGRSRRYTRPTVGGKQAGWRNQRTSIGCSSINSWELTGFCIKQKNKEIRCG